jgi:hypothetical protein
LVYSAGAVGKYAVSAYLFICCVASRAASDNVALSSEKISGHLPGMNNSTDIASRSATTRSAITNGRMFDRSVDGRSAASRRFKDVCAALTRDLGAAPTITDLTLIRQAAALVLRAEQLQASIVNGEAVDDEDLVRTSNALQRALAALGVNRRKRSSAVPTLEQYLQERSKATESAA